MKPTKNKTQTKNTESLDSTQPIVPDQILELNPPKFEWIKAGAKYMQREISQSQDKLLPGIYNLEVDSNGNLYLSALATKFDLPPKIYANENEFIARVQKTWENVKGNLGIVLTGERGSGKTVTAKQICNNLHIPVILVSHNYKSAFVDFAKGIKDICAFMFDEYEKVFEQAHELLSYIDGVETPPDSKKLFILTTNDNHINYALLNRPSRIRYNKVFGNLQPAQVEEILKDRLIHTDLYNKTFDYIQTLENITIDNVFSIIQEVNIHNALPKDFNVVVNSIKNLYLVTKTKKPGARNSKEVVINHKLINTQQKEFKLYTLDEGDTFYFGGRNYGEVKSIDIANGIVSTRIHADQGDLINMKLISDPNENIKDKRKRVKLDDDYKDYYFEFKVEDKAVQNSSFRYGGYSMGAF